MRRAVLVMLLAASAATVARSQSEKIDYAMIGRIRDEGLRRSQVMDHIDELIDGGILGDPHPNAADFQIAARVRELMQDERIRPHLEGRQAARHWATVCPRIG